MEWNVGNILFLIFCIQPMLTFFAACMWVEPPISTDGLTLYEWLMLPLIMLRSILLMPSVLAVLLAPISISWLAYTAFSTPLFYFIAFLQTFYAMFFYIAMKVNVMEIASKSKAMKAVKKCLNAIKPTLNFMEWVIYPPFAAVIIYIIVAMMT